MASVTSAAGRSCTRPSSSASCRGRQSKSRYRTGVSATMTTTTTNRIERGRLQQCAAAEVAVGADATITVPAHPPTILSAEEIMEILPHRYPFLLVDKIIDMRAGEYAVGVKNVTINDNFFPGHFPERAIMPGVLQIEALAQVGGVLMLNGDVGGDKSSFFFGGVDKCKFRKPVVPGDTLVLRTELVKLRKRFGFAAMRGEGFVNGEKVIDCDMTMYLGSKE